MRFLWLWSSGRGLGPLTQSTEYLGASIRNLGDLARVKPANAA